MDTPQCSAFRRSAGKSPSPPPSRSWSVAARSRKLTGQVVVRSVGHADSGHGRGRVHRIASRRCAGRAGHDVRILDALVPQVHGADAAWPAWVPAGVDARRGDVRHPEVVGGRAAGCEVVYHLAAEVGVGQSMYEITRYMDANTMGTAHLLEILAHGRYRPRSSSSPRRCRSTARGRIARPAARWSTRRCAAIARCNSATGTASIRTPSVDAAADRRGQAAAADVDLRRVQARPGGDVPVGGPGLRHSDRGVPLLQRLRAAPGAVEPVHRRGGNLQRPAAERQGPGDLRGRPAGARLHQRQGHRAGPAPAARDRRRRLRGGQPRHRAGAPACSRWRRRSSGSSA